MSDLLLPSFNQPEGEANTGGKDRVNRISEKLEILNTKPNNTYLTHESHGKLF